MPEFHAEPYIYLAGLTHKTAIIAWGGFYFKVSGKEGDEFKLVDDGDLDHIHPPRHQTIGANSEPYGDAVVEVFEAATGNPVAARKTSDQNHVVIQGLQPDTEYTYKITVNGEEWGQGERRDWVVDGGKQGLKNIGGRYDNRFRTHPHPEVSAPLTFAVLGDFGTGVRKPSGSDRRQREIAAALEKAVNEHDIRLLLTTGDNIYASKTFLGIPIGGTGDEDDDWFFTFYQPYRYIINRIPVYPCVGNHDSGETEASDDRKQLMENFYIDERFKSEEAVGRASLNPGLFYKFCYGSDIEFVCIDSSKEELFDRRLFLSDKHAPFVQECFPDVSGDSNPRLVWRIPFSHHPLFSAGPQHHNSRSMIDALAPLFKRSGVRVALSGHEHNFQHSQVDDISYFITGAGGKLRSGSPTRFDAAGTSSWAAATHFLLIKMENRQMVVRPIGELDASGNLADITLRDRSNQPVGTPIIIAG